MKFPFARVRDVIADETDKEVESYLTDHIPFRQALVAVDSSMQQMVEGFSPVEGTYEKEGSLLRIGESDPVPYTLNGSTLSFNVEGFGDLVFVRVG